MILLACPRCNTLLEREPGAVLRCPKDGELYRRQDGIWPMLIPERRKHFERFVEEYERVRHLEGRGSADRAYYHALPYHDSAAWRIRSRSYEAFLAQVLEPLEDKAQRPLRLLDLGAGNGWLAARLAQRGHDVGAVDLTLNDFDGLGCWRHYAARFLPVQAEFERLPFPDGLADLAIFNASFHYSIAYENTLREAMRVLAPQGRVVVLDTPVYHDPASGSQMVQERRAQFTQKYGFPSDALEAEEYLTWSRLEQLGNDQGLAWSRITPGYGLAWAVKPWVARALRRREPAGFHIIQFARA